MNILYISSMFDSETYAELFTKKIKPLHAANKYHTLLCEGLANNEVSVTVYSVLPVNRENCDRKYVKVKTKKGHGYTLEYPGFINFPLIKHIMLFFCCFFKVLFSARDTIVIYDVLVVAASYGAVLGAKLRRKTCVGIVTDLPRDIESLGGKLLSASEKIMELASSYIFLTEHMNEEVNKKEKPFIIVEGLVDLTLDSKAHANFRETKKKIIYAGTLNKLYGIKNLCEAFIKISKSGEELHIYGDGDYALELIRLAEKHDNIIYHGNRPNIEVVEAEFEAYLLVNPRPTEGAYTKFSFPSKTLEYMVSGTPVLTARLEGIPKEYDSYLLYFDDKVENGIEVALRDILNKTPEEMALLGKDTREFALKHKNNKRQARRVIDFLQEETRAGR